MSSLLVNGTYHLSVNGNHKALAKNLPTIVVLLRYRADPRF